jgi:hypothetical protein
MDTTKTKSKKHKTNWKHTLIKGILGLAFLGLVLGACNALWGARERLWYSYTHEMQMKVLMIAANEAREEIETQKRNPNATLVDEEVKTRLSVPTEK